MNPRRREKDSGGESRPPEGSMKNWKVVLGLGIVLGVVGGTFLAAFGVLYVKPYMVVRTMVHATCTTVSRDFAEDVVHCACANYGRGPCLSRYRCLQVFVNVTSRDLEGKSVVTNVTLYDSQETFILQNKKLQCSYHQCDRDPQDNDEAVVDFSEEYGETGTQYDCFYEPSDLSYAIVEVVTTNTIIHCMLWPSLALVIGFTILLVYLNDPSQAQHHFNSLERPWLRQQTRYECIVDPGEANAAAISNNNASGNSAAHAQTASSRSTQNLSHSSSSPVAQLI